MKLKAILISSIMLFSLVVTAQKKKIPQPEILSQPNLYNRQTNTLTPLERTVAEFKTKTKAFGLGGLSQFYSLNGAKASQRMVESDSSMFIVKLGDGMGDPSAWFNFYHATIVKGKRIGTYITTQVIGNKTDSGKESLSFQVKSLGNNCFAIIPYGKLPKGEYFFVNKSTLNDSQTQADSFAFGID